MNALFVYVGGENKFILAAQDLPRQLHAIRYASSGVISLGSKRLDEVSTQVYSSLSMAWRRVQENSMSVFSMEQPEGHQQLPVHLVGIADIVNGRFQVFRGSSFACFSDNHKLPGQPLRIINPASCTSDRYLSRCAICIAKVASTAVICSFSDGIPECRTPLPLV